MKKKSIRFLTVFCLSALLAGCGAEESAQANQNQVAENTGAENGGVDLVVPEVEETNADLVEEEGEPEVVPEGMYRSELTNEIIDEALKDQRPIAVMVDNESAALPHYGVNQADIVYEIMNSTENGRITRLMCIVKDWAQIEQLGSIRSVRTTNFVLAAEYNAVIIHDGGPFYINDYIAMPYSAHLSGGFARFSNGKAQEFTEYVTYEDYKNPSTGKSFDGLKDRMEASNYSTTYDQYYPGTHFIFSDVNYKLSDSLKTIEATDLDLPFTHNSSELFYDEESKTYQYHEYGKEHVDALTKEVTSFKNVILQSCSFVQLDKNGYLTYNAIGKGNEGYYITNGEAVEITWSKANDTAVTHFYVKETGEEIVLNTGKTYISLIPSDSWKDLVIK